MELARPRKAQHELISPGDGASVLMRQFTSPGFTFAWHSHPELELTMITRGHGRRFVGDAVEEFSAGDCVLIGPDLPHTWQSAADSRNNSALVLQMRPDLGLADLDGVPELRPLLDLTARSSQGLRIPLPLSAEVATRLEHLARLPPGLERLGGTLALLGVLAGADLPALCLGQAVPERDRDPLPAVLSYIEARCRDALPEPQVADLAGMAVSTFSRWFHRRTGVGFAKHLIQVRVARACRLLAESDAPVTEIALASGFLNLSNFNRRFMSVKGCTPSAYRRSFRV